MPALRLSPFVWLVGGSEGPAATDPYDGNQYLVWDGSRGVLIDCGTGRGHATWLRNIAEVTGDLSGIAGVLITHYHADHAGGASAAAAAGIPVYASAAASAALRDGDEQVTQVTRAREAGVYPADYRLSSCPSAMPLPADGMLDAGEPRVRAIDAPGHCDGHVVFALEERDGLALFTGDALFPGGRVSIQAIPDCRLDVYGETMQDLDRLPVVALYPGHGEPELAPRAARDAVRSAASAFARLVPPPNLLS